MGLIIYLWPLEAKPWLFRQTPRLQKPPQSHLSNCNCPTPANLGSGSMRCVLIRRTLRSANDQVLRMRDIYSKSVATISWLGLPANQSDEAFNLIHLLSRRKPQELYEEIMEMKGENNYKHLWMILAN